MKNILKRLIVDFQENPVPERIARDIPFPADSKKIYIIDNSYKRLYDAFAGQDTGKLYENLVFLHLRRQTPDIYYFKQAYEVDFFVKGNLINVSTTIDNLSTRQRETRSLDEAMNHLGCTESLLLTAETGETIKTKSGTIHVLPVWEWLCSL